MDLINSNKRIVPVGRLDMYTSGALILSNDGDLIYKITHPKHEITKTYEAIVDGKVDDYMIKKLREGIEIDNYITKPAKAEILSYDANKDVTKIKIIIHEGKNRQVRKMLAAVGKQTIELERTKIGDISTQGLKYGQWRLLKKEEVDKLIK